MAAAVLGAQDSVLPPEEVDFAPGEDLVVVAAENQGLWEALVDPTEADPVVWIDLDSGDRVADRERLSGFLLRFALGEAAVASPFAGHATITRRKLARFAERMTAVPLEPGIVPSDPTTYYVGPGVVAQAEDTGSEIELYVGSRLRAGLQPLRRWLSWDRFDG
jgi:hypothetical protein